jgi:vesicle-fusing ATPase
MFNRGGMFGGGGAARPDPNQDGGPRGGPAPNYSRPQQGSFDSRSGGYGTPPPQYGGAAQRVPVGARPPAQSTRPSRSSAGAMQLKPIKSPGGNAYAFGNLVAVSPIDFNDRQDVYLILNARFVVTARPTQGCNPGEIGLTDAQRTWAGISLGPNDTVQVQRYEPFSDGDQGYLGQMDAEVGFATRKTVEAPYDQEELQAIFTANFENQYFAPGQIILMDHKVSFLIT